MMWESNLPIVNKGEVNSGKPSEVMFRGSAHDFLTLNEPILQSITMFICTFGLSETAIVIWFLSIRIKTSNPMTTYFLNLAVADFSILTSLLVFASLSITENYHNLATSTSLIKLPVIFLFLFAYTTALGLMTAISVERCLSVYFPIWYRCGRQRYISIIVSFVIWFISGLLFGITTIFYYVGLHESSVMMIWIICSGNIFILTLLMVVSTLMRFTRIFCDSQDQPKTLRITLPLTLIFFIFFAIPVSVFYLMDLLCYTPTPRIMLICFLLASFNSTANPLIYYVIGGQWKHWDRRRTRI